MSTILGNLSTDHRHCDETLSKFESAVAKKNWDDVNKFSSQFIKEMNRHLNFEENVLFPSFEQATGMTYGPTMVMRSEHTQMRELFEEIKEATAEKNADRLLGLSETLMIFIQQHNNKEEQMLYVMCDMHLADKVEEMFAQFNNF